jgi:hypothetical protein
MTPDTNKGRPMLRLYRDVYAFADLLNAADHHLLTRAEMQFIADIRFRHMRHHPEMRLRWKEHVRLCALAVLGWAAALIEEERINYAHDVRCRLARQCYEEDV